VKSRVPAPALLAILLVIAVATLWAVAVRPAYERLEAGAARLVEKEAGRLLEGLDLRLSYRGASPRLLGSLRFHGVTARSGDVSVAIETLRIDFDPRALLAGRLRLGTVRVEDASIDASLSGLEDLVSRIAEQASRAAPSDSSEAGPSLKLRRIALRLSVGEGLEASAAIKTADVAFDPDGLARASLAGSLEASDPSRRFGLASLSIPIALSGRIRLGPSLGASIVADLQAKTDLGRLAACRLRLGIEDAVFNASIEPVAGLRALSARWDSRSAQIEASARLEAFRPNALFSPSGALAAFQPWFEAAYTGSLSLRGDGSLEGSAVEVSLSGRLPLDLPGGRPLVSLEAKGGWESLSVRRASLRTASLEARFSGEVLPSTKGASGSLAASYVLKPGLETRAEFQVSGADRSWFAYAPELAAADASLRDAVISLELGQSLVSFYLDAALPEGAAEEGPSGLAMAGRGGLTVGREAGADLAAERLVIEGSVAMDGAGPRYLESAIRLGTLRLAAFPRLLGELVGSAAAPLLAPLVLQGEFAVYSDFSSLSYNSSSFLFAYDGPVKGFGVARFSGGRDRLSINAFDASIAGFSVNGSAALDYGTRGTSAFEAAFQVRDVPYALTGVVAGPSIVISGDYGLGLSATSEGGSLEATLQVEDLPLPLLGSTPFLSTVLRCRFAALDDWDLEVERLALEPSPGSASVLPSIELSGSFDEGGGRFSSLSVSDKISTVRGAGDVTWAFDGGLRVSTALELAGSGGERYALTASYGAGGEIGASLKLAKAPLARLPLPALKGVVDAELTLGGTLEDPRARVSFVVNEGPRAKGLAFISGTGTYGDGIVQVRDMRARLDDQGVSNLALSYALADATLSLSTDFELRLGANVFSGVASASGRSPSKDPLLDFEADGSITELGWSGDELADIPFSLRLSDERFALRAGPREELKASYGPAGELALDLSPRLPLSFNARGRLEESTISLDVNDAVADMPFLFRLIGLPIIRVDSGTGRGSGRIRGKLTDPDVEAAFGFENFYISVPDFVKEPVGPLNDPLYFTGRTMETVQSSARCGPATVVASLKAGLLGGIPNDVSLSVKTTGPGLVPAATKLLGLDIEGMARPDLLIKADPNRASISGSIFLNSGDIVLTTGLVKRKPGPPSTTDFSGALDLSFGKDVKVYFPNKDTFPVVLYGQTDPSSALRVTFDTGKEDYSLKGDTRLRGGSVFFIQKNFYLKDAVINFDENADRFDPKINAIAELRTTGPSGPVTITIRAVDARFSNLTFRLESTPALSEDQIRQLLGQGFKGGSEDGRVDIGRIVIENYDLIPELNLAPILERNLQTILGLDLLVLRSQAVPRLLYGLSGLSESASAMTLADYLGGTAIVGGKYLGDKLFLQTRLGLDADPLASTLGLRLDSELSLEWQAPHFTLLWSLRPVNFDSLFIEDQSFSFLWRIPLR